MVQVISLESLIKTHKQPIQSIKPSNIDFLELLTKN